VGGVAREGGGEYTLDRVLRAAGCVPRHVLLLLCLPDNKQVEDFPFLLPVCLPRLLLPFSLPLLQGACIRTSPSIQAYFPDARYRIPPTIVARERYSETCSAIISTMIFSRALALESTSTSHAPFNCPSPPPPEAINPLSLTISMINC
jgi:hypothetical protein